MCCFWSSDPVFPPLHYPRSVSHGLLPKTMAYTSQRITLLLPGPTSSRNCFKSKLLLLDAINSHSVLLVVQSPATHDIVSCFLHYEAPLPNILLQLSTEFGLSEAMEGLKQWIVCNPSCYPLGLGILVTVSTPIHDPCSRPDPSLCLGFKGERSEIFPFVQNKETKT